MRVEPLLVQEVAPKSPAAALGLKGGVREITWDDEKVLIGGDIVLSVNGIAVREENEDTISRATTRVSPGATFAVLILRGGKIVELFARK
jgi:serine protease Do